METELNRLKDRFPKINIYKLHESMDEERFIKKTLDKK
jgi:hypothetical protein